MSTVSATPWMHSSESPLQASIRRFLKNRLAIAGLIFVGLLVIVCLVGPEFSPYMQSDQDLELQAAGPSAQHWMGTDSLGRDIATRVLHGGRISLQVALLSTLVAAGIGVLYGMIAGLAGRRLDAAMMRAVDILYSFPLMAFVILLTALVGRNFYLLFIAIGAVEWLTTARIVRSQVLSLRKQEFVTAARSYGATTPRILWRHMLPNVLGQAIISASLTVPGVMLLEAALSFLGLGIQPPDASWGVLIRNGADEISTAPWLLIFPGLAFSLTLMALNFVGDGLRDALDPKAN